MPSEAAETRALSLEQRARLGADGAASVLTAERRLSSAPDPERLARALDALRARHDVLRHAFRQVPGYRGLRQAEADPLPVPVVAGGDPARALDPERGITLAASLVPEPEGVRLVLAASALALDRASLARLLADIVEALASGLPPADDEAMTYAQYADWREEVAADDADGAGRAYWQAQRDAGASLRLPYRDGAAASRPIVLRRQVEPILASAFAEALAGPDLSDLGVEPVLQAAWWLLLGRVAGRDRFVAGWQHDCRRDYEVFAGTLGVFTKTLPLRLTLAPDESVAGLARTLANRLDEHRDFQEHCPLDEAGCPVGLSLATPAGADDPAILGPTGFELCLEPVLDGESRLVALGLHADARHYGEAALGTLLDQYTTILSRLGAHAATPFSGFPLIGAAEEARLLALGRPGPRALPDETLPALIARHAQSTPDAPALAGGGLTLSYAELETRVARLGARLAAQGVGPERIVALDMPRSPDLIVAILAIWRAGGAYLPLDPSWPQARRDQLAGLARPLLTLRDAALPDADDAPRDVEPGDPARMACLIFTSGSTGTPKGVVVEHAQVTAYTEAVIEALDLAGCRRFALTATVAADLGNTVLFAALRLGACLVVASEPEMADGRSFAAFLRANAIDCTKLVPSHLAALLDTDEPVLPARLIFGGEPCPAPLVARIRALSERTRIANHYGPTETCVGVLVHPVDPGEPVPADGLPLSRVLPGSEAYILNERGGLAPTGTAGILHIGGAQLCRGYLPGTEPAADDPFVENPFGPGRLYRTGDRARYRPEGGLAIAGRADDQLKLNGHRVEPGEVEAALSSLDGVAQAAVRAWTPAAGEPRLAAYAVAPGQDAASLRERLAEILPAPMLPAVIVLLDAMPRLGNGKIDRAALPEPDVSSGSRTVPRTALETVLADAMADLLGRPAGTLDAGDDFFDAGGHSLLVIKLAARIRKLLRVEVPPGVVFDHRSPAALAEALGRHAAPERLEETARLRLELAGMSEAERAALSGSAS